jgi:hydroxymethylpyrimidine pyrophosphatase-like HAD family hydrolase
MDERSNQEKLVAALIGAIGIIITLAGVLAKANIHNETLGNVIEYASVFVGGVGVGGLPIGLFLDWLRRRKMRQTGEEVRKLFEKMVNIDSRSPKRGLPKLIAMDIEGCITPSGRQAVDMVKLQRLRVYCDLTRRDQSYPPVIFYTGRSQGYAELLAQELGIVDDPRDIPCVIESGTALYYPNSKRTVLLGSAASLQSNRVLIHEVSELLRAELPTHEFEPKCYMITINPAPNQNVEDLLTLVDRILHDNRYETNRADTAAPADPAKRGCFRVTSSASAVDITPESLTKLNGLLEVAKEAARKNIPQNGLDETTAVGDHSNDVEVLRAVGRAYCPAEAHPDVIRVVKQKDANNVIPRRDIEFVMRMIELECGLKIVDPLVR